MSRRGIHEEFSYQAKVRPGDFAIRDGDRSLTYADLEAASDAWCVGLRNAGVSRGDVVAISLPRGVDLIIGILGVLKRGAVYGVLLPEWPPQRSDEAIRAMGARLLISTQTVSDLCSTSTPEKIASETEPVAVEAEKVTDHDPACVYFTSGTTGEPKCVLTTHGAMTRLFTTPGVLMAELRPVIIPLAAPPAWDAFGFELWAALLTGGVSVVIGEPFLSANALRVAVRDSGVNTAWLTSSLFNVLVDEDLESFTGLHQLFVGGEKLSVRHVRHFLRRHPSVRFVNGYGPVESVVFATTQTVDLDDCDHPDGIPIGRPVPGTRIHVLNGDEQCPRGNIGELCISGEGLALEYLSDTERTNQAFKRVSIEGVPTRIYRTGDRGRQLEDGTLQCFGRIDRQVKLRGIRVEPEEVEKQIEDEPSVHRCRVVPRRDNAGSVDELIAFCIPVDVGDDLAGLHEALALRMAGHHLPGDLVPIVEFPLSSQGKLDEGALLLKHQAFTRSRNVVPRHGYTVAAPDDIWMTSTVAAFSSILGLERVNADMTFFELGGTSLQAARVCARLSSQLSQTVSISDLYRSPTARTLGAQIRKAAKAPTPEDDVVVPLSPMQTVFLTRHLLNGDDQTNTCLVVWEVEGELDLERLQVAIDAVHLRHETLSAFYTLQGSSQLNCPSATLADIDPPPIKVLPACATLDEGTETLRAALAHSLDPVEGCLWRVTAIHVGSRWLIGCAVHHIAFDGWSEHLLARDLSAFYSGLEDLLPQVPTLSTRKPASRDEDQPRYDLLGVPFLDWGVVPTELEISSPQATSFALSADVVAALRERAACTGHTLFVALLTSWVSCLSNTVDQNDFCIGIPVSQRDNPRFQHAIGCFMTTVPVRFRDLEVTGDIKAVGTSVNRAFALQDVSLSDLLAQASSPGSERPPLFQTLFALQNTPPPTLTLDDQTSRFIRQPYFDLPLELHVEIWPDGDGLHVEILYRPSAITEGVANHLAEAYSAEIDTFLQEQTA